MSFKMSDNHDLLNDNDMYSFSGYEADDMCFNNDIATCGDNSCTTSDRFIRILDLREGTLRGFSGLTRVTEKHKKKQFQMV